MRTALLRRGLSGLPCSNWRFAWDFFFGSPRPWLVDYVGDRDLWKFELPRSREVSASIFSYPYTFENWDRLDRTMRGGGSDLSLPSYLGISVIADEGKAIERKHHKDIAELVANNRRRMIIGGIEVWVANLPYTLASDAGNLMAKGQPFAACYWDTAKNRVFSLRSTDEGMDVSAIAASYGGGGHVRASGFQRPLGWEGDKP